MIEKAFSTPEEITEIYNEIGKKKAARPVHKQLLLGLLAGSFVAMVSQGSHVAVHTIANISIARTLSGALFSTALVLIVIAGGELFTGNTLMVIAAAKKRITVLSMLRNWLVVYCGNFLGALTIVTLINISGQLNLSGGSLGGYTILVAVNKVNLPFHSAFIFGIFCNWLVCLAVWMSSGAQDVAGKILSIFFPIWIFVISGFEHSIANMYYIPAGILAMQNPEWVTAAIEVFGVTPERMANLNWFTLFRNNLLPVTLGNLVGGGFFVGISYLIAFGKLDPTDPNYYWTKRQEAKKIAKEPQK
ncbi:MAG: formate/nitrite transporter family protein [Oscillospiraceae bacterium]|nr:formate/nitrite transporter family protein [Oscillospiraceae bacterium]